MIGLSGGRLESISSAGGGANRTCYSMDRPLFRLLVTSTVEPLPNSSPPPAPFLRRGYTYHRWGWRPNPYPRLASFKEGTELGNRLAHADRTDPLENVVDGEMENEEEVSDIEEVSFFMIIFFSREKRPMYNAITVALDIHLDCSLGGYME